MFFVTGILRKLLIHSIVCVLVFTIQKTKLCLLSILICSARDTYWITSRQSQIFCKRKPICKVKFQNDRQLVNSFEFNYRSCSSSRWTSRLNCQLQLLNFTVAKINAFHPFRGLSLALSLGIENVLEINVLQGRCRDLMKRNYWTICSGRTTTWKGPLLTSRNRWRWNSA